MIQNQVGGGSGDVVSVLTGSGGTKGKKLIVKGITTKHKILSITFIPKDDWSISALTAQIIISWADGVGMHAYNRTIYPKAFDCTIDPAGGAINISSYEFDHYNIGSYKVVVYGPPIN